MSNQTPVFRFHESEHYNDNDYGFDPQFHYFQVLEEAMKHKKVTTDTSLTHFNNKFRFQKKTISKDESSKKIKKQNKKRWWKNALLFFKGKRHEPTELKNNHKYSNNTGLHNHRNGVFKRSISGPVYITESRSGSSTPYSTASRPSSGPLAGILSPTAKGNLQIPYISLREINMESTSTKSTSSAMPIYLVT